MESLINKKWVVYPLKKREINKELKIGGYSGIKGKISK